MLCWIVVEDEMRRCELMMKKNAEGKDSWSVIYLDDLAFDVWVLAA